MAIRTILQGSDENSFPMTISDWTDLTIGENYVMITGMDHLYERCGDEMNKQCNCGG